MKRRILSLAIIMVLIFSFFPLQTFAAEDEKTFTYQLTVDGKDTKRVETGDIITVMLKLRRTDAEENYNMHSMQDEIRYDSTFFRLVEGGAITSTGITVTDIAMVDHHREYYMNYLSFSDNEIWSPETIIGSFQLEVTAENGITNLTNQDFLVSLPDGSGSYECTATGVKVILSEDCTVIFETNGGSDVPQQTVTRGNKITRPDDPVKEGFTFAGWYSDYELTQPWNFGKDTVEYNMHLYAAWAEGTHADTVPGSTPKGRCCCWLWLLLLIIVYLIYRYYKKKKEENKIEKI